MARALGQSDVGEGETLKQGSVVRVMRSNGAMEEGWKVIVGEFKTHLGRKMVFAGKESNKKLLPAEWVKRWTDGDTRQYPFEVGDKVLVERTGSGVPPFKAELWQVQDTNVTTNNWGQGVRVGNASSTDFKTVPIDSWKDGNGNNRTGLGELQLYIATGEDPF